MERKKGDCYHSFITGGRRVSTPYYIDVSVLSSQVQRRDSVGIGGFRFQHGCTHVAAEQELDHLEAETQSERQKPDWRRWFLHQKDQLADFWVEGLIEFVDSEMEQSFGVMRDSEVKFECDI